MPDESSQPIKKSSFFLGHETPHKTVDGTRTFSPRGCERRAKRAAADDDEIKRSYVPPRAAADIRPGIRIGAEQRLVKSVADASPEDVAGEVG